MINALVRCNQEIRRPAVKQDNKAKQNRGNQISAEAPQGTFDLGRRRWRVQREGLTVGLDVGDKISHYCVLDEEAEVVQRGKLKTTPAGLQPWMEALPASTRVVLETGTHSSWISRLIEQAGPETLVAQPRKIPQIYACKRKNDRRDAEKLAHGAAGFELHGTDPAPQCGAAGGPGGDPGAGCAGAGTDATDQHGAGVGEEYGGTVEGMFGAELCTTSRGADSAAIAGGVTAVVVADRCAERTD